MDTGELRGFKLPTPLKVRIFLLCVCTRIMLLVIKSNFLRENVKNCTLISHFAQLLRDWTSLGEFPSPRPLARPPFGKFMDSPLVKRSMVKSRVRVLALLCHLAGSSTP